VFDAFDTTAGSLEVSMIVLQNLTLNRERMRAAASKGMLNATELADYLVRKGVPFREAHETVGKAVLQAIEKGVELGELPLDELRALSNMIETDVLESLTLEQTLATKSQIGGTAPERVAEALVSARKLL
jgi:argininosuccinate lyase